MFSAFLLESCWASSFPIEELKQTQPKSELCHNWLSQQTLNKSKKLAGCVAALRRFISRLGEKALPLYRLLRRTDHFEWTDAATTGLEEIKALLASNPILAASNAGEPMLLYISATHQVVSAVLVVEREQDGHKFPLQKLVYYVSTVLTPCKSRYPHYQKK